MYKLVQDILTAKRYINMSYMFLRPTRISNLYFLGAHDFFITEFGTIWQKSKMRTNKYGYLIHGSLPYVVKDAYYPYPWSYLNIGSRYIWVPLNQILGWAFETPKDIDHFYFLSKYPGLLPLSLKDFSYQKAPEEVKYDSRYLKFMKTMIDLTKSHEDAIDLLKQ